MIYFHAAESSNQQSVINPVRANHLDAAVEQARAYLLMTGGAYDYAEIHEEWRTMWRHTGKRIDYTCNL